MLPIPPDCPGPTPNSASVSFCAAMREIEETIDFSMSLKASFRDLVPSTMLVRLSAKASAKMAL